MTKISRPESKPLVPLRVFVACPSDCSSERKIVEEVAIELEALANHRGRTLRVCNWTQLVPDMGRPQEVIFNQAPVESWDVLVCILWLRFGIKSGGNNAITGSSAESGTEEEFSSALKLFKSTGRPRILFYRRIAGPHDISRLDTHQLNLVQDFFKKFDQGQAYEGLYKPYEAPDDFRRLVRDHLQTLLIQGTEVTVSASTISIAGQIPKQVVLGWRDRLLSSYDILKLHRISSAYDAGSVFRADRDRVRLHEIFVPQDVSDVSAYVAERLPASRELARANPDELRFLGLQQRRQVRNDMGANVYQVLDQKKNRQAVLLGSPGAGKSSLLQHRVLTWARDPALAGPVPLLLEMRQYAARVARAREEQQPVPSLLKWAGELLGAASGTAPIAEDVVKEQFAKDRMELYCDALDEIFDPELRRETAEQLLQLSIKIPDARIILTSRPVGYPDDVLGSAGFSHWLVRDFDNNQVHTFLARWIAVALLDEDDRAKVKARMNSALISKRVREMAGNPLLLTLMCILSRTDELPRDRMRLYAKAAELLLYQWDTSRSLRPIAGLDFAYEQKHRVLRELAWRMQTAQLGLGGNLASLEMVRSVFDEELRADLERPGERARGVSLLLETLRTRDHVLCHVGGDHFAFVHRGFLEYFCADWLCELVRRAPSTAENDLFKIFQKYSLVSTWGEILELGLVGLASEVMDPILAKMDQVLTKQGTFPEWLAAGTLNDAKSRVRYIKTVAALRRRLVDSLRSRNPQTPRSALIAELVRYWRDQETCDLLIEMVEQAPTFRIRRIAMGLLVKHWRTEKIRALVANVAQNYDGRLCRTALGILAGYWRDDATKELLIHKALGEPDRRESETAINQLAIRWHDADVKKILQERAAQVGKSRVGQAARLHLHSHRWRQVQHGEESKGTV